MRKILSLLFILSACCLPGAAQLTNVNIGAAPNDGTGDTVRAAFGKVNYNVGWLYTALTNFWGTNVPGSGLTNLTLRWVTFTTNNYSTPAIQSALNTNGLVFCEPGTYYLDNLVFTNGMFLEGFGAHLIGTNRSGIFLNFSNAWYGGLIGVDVDGGSTVDWSTNPTGFVLPFEYWHNDPAAPAYCSNRFGLFVNAAGSCVFQNLTIRGWEGVGLQCWNPLGLVIPMEPVQMGNIYCVSNYIGVATALDPFMWGPLIGGSPSAPAEYMPLKGLTINNNNFGIILGAGNCNLTGDVLVKNWCSIFFFSTPNEGHGIVSGCTINHSQWPIAANNLPLGELISDNIFAADGNFIFNNAANLEFKNNRISGSPGAQQLFISMEDNPATITYSNRPNYFVGNSFSGLWGTTDVVENSSFSFSNSASYPSVIPLVHWGNYSATSNLNYDAFIPTNNGTAGQMFSWNQGWSSDGSSLTFTNVAPTSGTTNLGVNAAGQLVPVAGVVMNGPGNLTEYNVSSLAFYLNNLNTVGVAKNNLETVGNKQWGAYYNTSGFLVFFARNLTNGVLQSWTLTNYVANGSGTNSDEHDVVSFAWDKSNYVHVAMGMHVSALRYYRGQTPGVVTNLSGGLPMLGTGVENSSTYPMFITDPATGDLYYTWRNGQGGYGDQYFYAYNASNQTWSAAAGTGTNGIIFAGEPQLNGAYLNGLPKWSNGKLWFNWSVHLSLIVNSNEYIVGWDKTNWTLFPNTPVTMPLESTNTPTFYCNTINVQNDFAVVGTNFYIPSYSFDSSGVGQVVLWENTSGTFQPHQLTSYSAFCTNMYGQNAYFNLLQGSEVAAISYSNSVYVTFPDNWDASGKGFRVISSSDGFQTTQSRYMVQSYNPNFSINYDPVLLSRGIISFIWSHCNDYSYGFNYEDKYSPDAGLISVYDWKPDADNDFSRPLPVMRADQISSGTVSAARMGAGFTNAGYFLQADGLGGATFAHADTNYSDPTWYQLAWSGGTNLLVDFRNAKRYFYVKLTNNFFITFTNADTTIHRAQIVFEQNPGGTWTNMGFANTSVSGLTQTNQPLLLCTNGNSLSAIWLDGCPFGSGLWITDIRTNYLPLADGTSYANLGGTGNRSSIITVTQSTNLLKNNPQSLVDGNYSGTENYFYPGVSVSGAVYLRFDFGTGNTVVIDEAKYYQSTTDAEGTWQWQGSDDAVSWSNIGSSFTLGNATTQTITALNGNASYYRYYQLVGVSGTTSATPYVYQFDFKIFGL